MIDKVVPQVRSRMMASVKSRNTQPERAVRSWLHRNGFRFRTHRRNLPGVPDIVMPGRRIAIFVHGCFWHRHARCKNASFPASNVEFWRAKFDANVSRDKAVRSQLRKAGWTVFTVWECQTESLEALNAKMRSLFKLDAGEGPIHLSQPKQKRRKV